VMRRSLGRPHARERWVVVDVLTIEEPDERCLERV
jgi:hypothetical protein